MKHILSIVFLILATLMFLTACNASQDKIKKALPSKQDKQSEIQTTGAENKYKLEVPTQQELSEMVQRLDPILSMFHSDYDSSVDNIYEYMFDYNQLDYVYPVYDDEVKKYITEPIVVSEYGNMYWCEWNIPQNDPLGKFPKIRDEVYDENGNISEDLAYDLYERENLYWQDVIIGHNKFSGEYMDWLVEGVWNGKANHDSFMAFEDGTKLYYHDGFYYTPEYIGGRGGGIMFLPIIESITATDKNKYEIIYSLENELGVVDYRSKAVVGLKETNSGFRFWSIYSIDFDIENP